jgi:hypothetical protein
MLRSSCLEVARERLCSGLAVPAPPPHLHSSPVPVPPGPPPPAPPGGPPPARGPGRRNEPSLVCTYE